MGSQRLPEFTAMLETRQRSIELAQARFSACDATTSWLAHRGAPIVFAPRMCGDCGTGQASRVGSVDVLWLAHCCSYGAFSLGIWVGFCPGLG